MTQENPNSVTPGGVIPNEPNPNNGKGIPFSLNYDEEVEPSSNSSLSPRAVRGRSLSRTVEFNPVYYPDRYNDTMEKEVERTARQCGGEDVSIDKTKNPEFHATGIVLDGNVSDFRKIRKYKGPVNLVTPLTDNAGGMEVVITNAKIGEIAGWDGLYKQWQFKYTLDMVATGSDTDDSGESQVVSEVLEEYRN